MNLDNFYLADLEGSHRLIRSFKNEAFELKLDRCDLKKFPPEYLDDLINQLPKLTSTQFIIDGYDIKNTFKQEFIFVLLLHFNLLF